MSQSDWQWSRVLRSALRQFKPFMRRPSRPPTTSWRSQSRTRTDTIRNIPPITKAIADAGGKFLVRGGKTISYEGTAPAPRVVVVQFESLDKLQALYNSAAYKDAIAIGDKYATQRIFGVEGVSP